MPNFNIFFLRFLTIFFLHLTSTWAAVGQFYTYPSNFQNYYGGPSNGQSSPCYNSGNNRVYESQHFLIYSAGSSDNAVITLASLAEDELSALQALFALDTTTLTTSPANKLKVCADAKLSNEGEYFGAASGVGMSVVAVDNPSVQSTMTKFNYQKERRLIRHELTHYIQAISVGSTDPSGYTAVDRWFSEGLATYVNNAEFINTSLAISNWFGQGKVNPISIKTYQDQGNYSSGDIYPYYGSALAFIFGNSGANNSLLAVKTIFEKMKQGTSFANAFASTLTYQGQALTTANLQANYQSWLIAMWSKQESRLTVTNPSIAAAALIGINDDVMSDVIQTSAEGSISGNQLAVNASGFADGTYKLYAAKDDSASIIYGPISVSVKNGRVQATSCDFVALSCTGTPATTFTPKSGWWANPNESAGGRGFFFDIKGSNMFMGVYTYAPDGLVRWHVAGGAMSDSTSFSAPLFHLCCGQTLTSSVKPATTLSSPGNFAVKFTSATTGTITLPDNSSFPVERFNIVQNGAASLPAAGQPETGFWIGEGEIQRGFSLEIQNGTMFLVGYMYDSGGNAVWYGSLDVMSSANLYQSKWQQWGNGQPLTGALKAVQIVNTNLGPLTIQFTDTQNARLTMPGGYAVNFKRFVF